MLEIVSFDEIGMINGLVTPAEAIKNMDLLVAAIGFRAGQRIIIGPAKSYTISTSATNKAIQLASNAIVKCMPGCTITWDFPSKVGDTDSGILSAAAGVENASWTGGTFQSIPMETTVGGTVYKLYPAGSVVRVYGNNILIEDVTIDGYNGIAMAVGGDYARIINPAIRNPQGYVPAGVFGSDAIDANGAGIRVFQGKGFRCYGGSIDSGGDAALQFSGDKSASRAIEDGLYQGVRCTSTDGRLMLVGSTNPEISNVRFIGITGKATGDGDCIRVQNRERPEGSTNKPLRPPMNPPRQRTYETPGHALIAALNPRQSSPSVPM